MDRLQGEKELRCGRIVESYVSRGLFEPIPLFAGLGPDSASLIRSESEAKDSDCQVVGLGKRRGCKARGPRAHRWVCCDHVVTLRVVGGKGWEYFVAWRAVTS